MNALRKLLVCALAFVLVFSALPIVPVQANVVQSGTLAGVGGAPWRIYADGTLVIGAGRINNTVALSPWISFSGDILNIVIEGPAQGMNMRDLFNGLTNVQTVTGLENIDTSTATRFDSMFRGMRNLTSISGVSGWDTGNVTRMENMFRDANSLTAVDVGGWDTGRVTNMGSMFRENFALTTLDVANWDVSSVTSMNSMFRGRTPSDINPNTAHGITALDVSNWNTSSVIDMGDMFFNARNLTTLDVSAWDTSNVRNMAAMFSAAHFTTDQQYMGLTTLDVSNWDTSNVTNMRNMFMHASNLTALDVSNWDTSNVTLMQHMFRNVTNVPVLDVSSWNTGSVTRMDVMFHSVTVNALDVSGWDTSSVTAMNSMFQGASNLTQLDVSNWDTSNVVVMSSMFNGASSLEQLVTTHWNTENVTRMDSMFIGASSLHTLDVSGWDTGRVTRMDSMFRDTALNVIDVSGWDTGRVTRMDNMFRNVSTVTTLDVSGWSTVNVTSMTSMFHGAAGVTALDVSGWNTSNVTHMANLFNMSTLPTETAISTITELDVSGWNTSNVILMNHMFANMRAVTELEVSGWDTSNVTNMTAMFSDARALTTIDVSGWNTSRVTSMQNMFVRTNELMDLDVSGWDTSNVTDMRSMFHTSGVRYLDLSGWDTRNVTLMQAMFQNASALRRIHVGNYFINSTAVNLVIPNPPNNTEFTGLWLNIEPPGGVLPVTSAQMMALFQTPASDTNPQPSPGIWVWERHEGIVMLSSYPIHRFPTRAVGYTYVPTLSVAVANAGRTNIIVPLTVTLSGPDADEFELDLNMPPGIIAVGDSLADAFFIVPRIGLDAGTYTATVTVGGIGINTETFDVSFTVLPNSIEYAAVSFADAVFNGNPHTPSMTVTLQGEVLVEDVDFVIESWNNNINAGNSSSANPPSVTIRGINNFDYTGSVATREFTIRPRPVSVTIPGGFRITKVYDGTTSTNSASHTGDLNLSGALENDSTRLRVEWTSIDDFPAADVDDYELTLRGLHLVSRNSDNWHLNYDLEIAILTEVPGRITPATLASTTITRNVAPGAVRTVSIPLADITPKPNAPMVLGSYNVEIFGSTGDSVHATAEIAGGYLIITTSANKAEGDTETITIQFETQNFGNINVPVVLNTTAAQVFTVTFNLGGGNLTSGNLSQTVEYGSGATPPVVYKLGYTFTGWEASIANKTPDNITANVTFTATWSTVLPTIILTPSDVTINNTNQTVSVTVGGTATGAIVLDGNLPSGVLATVNGDEITITGTRPEYGQPAIIGNFIVTVTRGGVTETLYVNVNLTPYSSVPPLLENYVTYVLEGILPIPIANVTTPQALEPYVVVPVAQWPTTTATTNAEGIPGTWTFSGWSTSHVSLNGASPNQVFIMPNHDVVFTGSWTFTAASFNVNFDLNGGSLASGEILQLVMYGNAATPPIVTRYGYNFIGWVSNVAGMTYGDIRANVILTAQWMAIPVEPELPPMLFEPQPHPQPPTVQYVPSYTPTPAPQLPLVRPRPRPTPLPETPTPDEIDYDQPLSPQRETEFNRAYMFGDRDGNFHPTRNLTRAEAATMLARVMLLDFNHGVNTLPPVMTSFNVFADVNYDQWFYYYVAWAYNAGLVQGHAGLFRPQDPITREEFAALLVRATTAPIAGTLPFRDSESTSNWARAYVNAAHQRQLIVGDLTGNFRPRENITRAEAATAINRLLLRLDSRTALYIAYVENMAVAREFNDIWPTAWYYASVLAAANDHYLARGSNGAIEWVYIVEK